MGRAGTRGSPPEPRCPAQKRAGPHGSGRGPRVPALPSRRFQPRLPESARATVAAFGGPWLRSSGAPFLSSWHHASVSPSDAEPIHDVSNPFQAFQDLMPFRVQDILLVSSLYDSFTLQEDGRLNELIAGEFLELSLHHTPGLTHVSTGHEALALARSERRFNLVLSTLSPADMDATEIAREVKRAGLDIPVVAMAYDNDERKEFEATHDVGELDGLFLWQGNARILVAIV